jgi:plasmid stabilization system protein ParE
MKPVRVDVEAVDEIRAAAAWYEKQRPGLGDEFLASVGEAMAELIKRPSSAVAYAGVPDDLPVERLIIRRFRYSVVFIELETEMRVLAVAHPKRRPFYWRGRRQR